MGSGWDQCTVGMEETIANRYQHGMHMSTVREEREPSIDGAYRIDESSSRARNNMGAKADGAVDDKGKGKSDLSAYARATT